MTEQNQNTQAPKTGVVTDDISFDGVEPSLSQYFLKQWWLIPLAVVTALLLFRLGVLGLIPICFALAYLRTRYEDNLFAAFARANGYTYEKDGTLADQPGMLFAIGDDRKFSDIVTGTYHNWPIALFVYTYTIGSGRSRETFKQAVMSVNFATPMPAFVLRRPSFFNALDNRGESLTQNGYTEKLSLEGDFDKYFTVYCKPNAQVDVLSVLAPNVMELLLGLANYELEMTPSGVFYIYCRQYIDKKQSLIELYHILEAITQPVGLDADRARLLQSVAAQQP